MRGIIIMLTSNDRMVKDLTLKDFSPAAEPLTQTISSGNKYPHLYVANSETEAPTLFEGTITGDNNYTDTRWDTIFTDIASRGIYG